MRLQFAYPLLLCWLGGAISPVSRVVELLQSLAKKVEAESKTEEDLYESYVCWGKSVIAQKTASNSAAETRIDYLETYIEDLDSGRIELTSEGGNLEKDIAQLLSDLEQANALRAKESAEFEDAKAEMTAAINALQSAIDVLKKATAGHKQGSFLAVRRMESFAQQRLNIQRAAALGEKFLSKADATFLRRLLTGDVPKPDWKKLNRKATFKMSYKARSSKIQDTLASMYDTFKANLDDATEKERATQEEYSKLKVAKEEQLTAAREALTKSEAENGARGQTKKESEDEVAGLKQQIKSDTKFIAQTEAALATKKTQWEARSKLRAGEEEAISKAIHILHNDDSRDLLGRSLSSQEGLFFLQKSQISARALQAATVFRETAKKTGNNMLLALAAMAAQPDSQKASFAPVIGTIDKLIATLNQQEADDLKNNEDCEKGRMEDTRSAILDSRAVDEMTEIVYKLQKDIKAIEQEIVSLQAEKEKTAKELEAATELRKKEHAEWLQSDKDDKEAAVVVSSAKSVLADFYSKNFALLQKSGAPDVKAGEAPPPPPATWDGGYGGKTDEADNIVSMLGMIVEDIKQDTQKAKEEEDLAQLTFDTFKTESETQMQDLSKQISSQKSIVGKKELEIGNSEKTRRTKKGELDATLNEIAGINPNCEYIMVNYALRVANRHMEMDGLIKAKSILQGASYS